MSFKMKLNRLFMTKIRIKAIGIKVTIEANALVSKSKVRVANAKIINKQKIARNLNTNDNLYFL